MAPTLSALIHTARIHAALIHAIIVIITLLPIDHGTLHIALILTALVHADPILTARIRGVIIVFIMYKAHVEGNCGVN